MITTKKKERGIISSLLRSLFPSQSERYADRTERINRRLENLKAEEAYLDAQRKLALKEKELWKKRTSAYITGADIPKKDKSKNDTGAETK